MTYIAYPYPLNAEGSSWQNPTTSDPKKNDVVYPDYTEEEWQYRNFLIQRMNDAAEMRNRRWPEFSDKTYAEYYEQNEKIAHTYLEPTKDTNERKMSTGTIETKMNTLLAHVDNLNLTPEVLAYDRDNQKLNDIGYAFTDIHQITRDNDGGDEGGDKEKQRLRQLELLKQGTAFSQEDWIDRREIKKRLNQNYNGEFKNWSGYSSKLKKVFEGPSRQTLYGQNVYLGDITAFNMSDQPYVFTVEHMSYSGAKALYGQFDQWQYVRPGKPDASVVGEEVGARTIYDMKWRLTKLEHTQVEIIKYQCPADDDYMIIINGVMMLPPGFPLSAVTPGGRYNIAKQTLYVINGQFAYGKSFVSSGAIYELSMALDRMLRLFELKTRKSISPPYINTTNRVIPAKVLNPNSITMGLSPNSLQPIGNEGQGVTSSEFSMFRELQSEIERSTVSSVFQGQEARTGATATEVLEVQRQARLTLGLIVSACTLFEVKVGYLRHWNILEHWFKPVGKYSDGSNRYRNVSTNTTIEGSGTGTRRVIPIDGELPDPETVRMLSLEEEQENGFAVRRIYLSPKALHEANLTWYVTVQPKEDESTAYYKLQFREMLGDAATLLEIGAKPNVEGLTDKFAEVYNVDKAKLFSQNQMVSSSEEQQQMGRTIRGNIQAGNNIARTPSAGNNSSQPQPKPAE